MEAPFKYRKESENYSPVREHYHRSFKYHLSHERFIVPWQMDDIKQKKENEK
jgi:hypothetical protein